MLYPSERQIQRFSGWILAHESAILARADGFYLVLYFYHGQRKHPELLPRVLKFYLPLIQSHKFLTFTLRTISKTRTPAVMIFSFASPPHQHSISAGVTVSAIIVRNTVDFLQCILRNTSCSYNLIVHAGKNFIDECVTLLAV